jgi:hypothetical protein
VDDPHREAKTHPVNPVGSGPKMTSSIHCPFTCDDSVPRPGQVPRQDPEGNSYPMHPLGT